MDNQPTCDIEVTFHLIVPDDVSPEEVALVESQVADLMKQVVMETNTNEE